MLPRGWAHIGATRDAGSCEVIAPVNSSLLILSSSSRVKEGTPYVAEDEDVGDVFSMLLGSSAPNNDEQTRHILDGEEFCTELVRVTDEVCNASLQGQRLIFLAKTSAGNLKISVHASCGARESVPLYSSSPTMEYQLHIAMSTLPCSLVPASPLLPIDSTRLPEEFYHQLCGPDQFLLRAPLVLVGSQAGHVHCISNAPKPSLFCALNQPVVGIHLLEASSTMAGDAGPSLCSAIICVGQRGRVVLCQMGDPGQTAPRFSELQLNSPILCTCVIRPRRYLLYGTPDGVYGVRLLPPSSCLQQPEHSSLEVAFNFPQKMVETVAHLLMPIGAMRVVAVSLCGRVTALSIPSEGGNVCAETSDLKQVLRCIETSARQTAALSERLSSLDAALTELNEALTLSCDLSQRSATLPLQCKLLPTCVRRGSSSLHLAVHLTLEYTRHRPLGSGWSLLVDIRMKSGGQRTEVIPLEGLSDANAQQFSASFPVIPVAREPLHLSVCCLLHYTLTTSTEGVSFSLHEETFSAVHFLLPCDPSSLQQPASAAVYSASLPPLAVDVVQRQCRNPADVCEKALVLVALRHAGIGPDSYIRRGRQEAELTLVAYNGLPLTIVAHLLDDKIEISIRSSSEATVAEISSCVSRAMKVRAPIASNCNAINFFTLGRNFGSRLYTPGS